MTVINIGIGEFSWEDFIDSMTSSSGSNYRCLINYPFTLSDYNFAY